MPFCQFIISFQTTLAKGVTKQISIDCRTPPKHISRQYTVAVDDLICHDPSSSIYQLERVRDKPTKLRNHSQMMLHVLVLSAQISANSTVQRCNVTSVSGSHAVYSVKVFFLGRHISFKHIITIFNIYRL